MPVLPAVWLNLNNFPLKTQEILSERPGATSHESVQHLANFVQHVQQIANRVRAKPRVLGIMSSAVFEGA